MNIEENRKTSSRGPSEAAKYQAIETMESASREYLVTVAEISRLNTTPASLEKDEALTIQYGKRRLLGERLKAMGVDPDTIQPDTDLQETTPPETIH